MSDKKNTGIITVQLVSIETSTGGRTWADLGNQQIISKQFWEDVEWRKWAESIGLAEEKENK